MQLTRPQPLIANNPPNIVTISRSTQQISRRNEPTNAVEQNQPSRRGRKKGSKNKAAISREQAMAMAIQNNQENLN